MLRLPLPALLLASYLDDSILEIWTASGIELSLI